MTLIRKYGMLLGLTVLGVVGGLAYWHWWGCTDSCPLWSKAHWMALRGGVMGLCVAVIFSGAKWPFSKPKNDNPT